MHNPVPPWSDSPCHVVNLFERKQFSKVALLLLISSFSNQKHRMLNEFCRSRSQLPAKEEYSGVNISFCSQGPAIELSISSAQQDVRVQHYSKAQCACGGIFSPCDSMKGAVINLARSLNITCQG